MNSLIILIITFAGYIIAYHTYGKFIAKKIFRLNPDAIAPSEELRDNIDFIPTRKNVLFGHHFTSIAGLGPIVGPAIAVIWGWVPALIWVFFGSIFMGAIHDFGSLVISMRGEGRSLGDLTVGFINPRARTLFLLIIFFELLIVIAIFALIIAMLFIMYPQSVLPIWLQIPIAVYTGMLIYRKNKDVNILGLIAVGAMYLTIILGAFFPVSMPALFGISPLSIWIIILLLYAYIASILPVQTLLQPRDFINAYQLLITIALLIIGVIISQPPIIAPAFNPFPQGAPPLLPFLFIVIACGAISGFHSLVSSGTSSKQCDKESSCLFIGFGSMLLEGALAVLVIIAISAGLGLGLKTADGQFLKGISAFSHHYSSWAAANGLQAKLGSFVIGASNMISAFGIPPKITTAVMGVFLVSFAATTLDSATRIQRYVVTEIASAWCIPYFHKKHPATLLAIISAFILAFYNGDGKGALNLWPLFGTVNQLLAALALLVITIYLKKCKINISCTALPMLFMISMTAWAMIVNLSTFYTQSNWLLFGIGIAVFILEIWMIFESIFVLKKTYSKN
ncbi:MAG: carbon starvation protein A [Candidatus Omnitrophica bacterium]|nr:carbon starvation protein A [Candidatus Omnitrophota bacterium]